jgi:Flp pilus assembly protein TadG
MPTTQVDFREPPLRGSEVPKPLQAWLFAIQKRLPLRKADTTAGSYAEALPPAGLTSAATGETNQNQEITYVKTSADGNTFTITGAASGPVILAVQYATAKFKSDGTGWWKVG